MSTRTFAISTDWSLPRRWVRVRLHPDFPSLRAAAHALRPGAAGKFAECYGCFHPTTYRQHVETRAIRYPANGYAGTLRLVEPGAATDDNGNRLPYGEIVAHELVHAAATIYRMNVASVINLGGGRGKSFDREEDFAYIYGELSADMQAKLR